MAADGRRRRWRHELSGDVVDRCQDGIVVPEGERYVAGVSVPYLGVMQSGCDVGVEFGSYLDHGHADPSRDLVGYRQIPLWLTPAELTALITEVQALLTRTISHKPAPQRRQYLLSPILFPIAETEAEAADAIGSWTR